MDSESGGFRYLAPLLLLLGGDFSAALLCAILAALDAGGALGAAARGRRRHLRARSPRTVP
eukprot:2698302-Rhodomonas_salina.5